MPIQKAKIPSLFLALIALLPQAWAQPTPLPGEWERRLITHMFVHSTSTYAPWEHPVDTACLSDAALRKMALVSPAATKSRQEKEGQTCVISEERQTSGVLSWRMACKERDGTESVMTTTVMTSETEIRSSSVNRGSANSDALGPDGMKVELLMKRIGDCDKTTGSKN